MALKGIKTALGRWIGWFLCLMGLVMLVFNVTLITTLDAGTAIWFMVLVLCLTAYFLIANIEMDIIQKYQNKIYIGLSAICVIFGLIFLRAFSWLALMFAVNILSLIVVMKNERESFEKNKKTIVPTILAVNAVLTILALWLVPGHLVSYLIYLGAGIAAFFAWANLMSIFWDQKTRGFIALGLFEGVAWAYGIYLMVTVAIWAFNLLLAPILSLVGLVLILVVEKKMIKKKLLVYIKN